MNYNRLYDGAEKYLDTFLHEQHLDDGLTDAFVEGGKYVLGILASKIRELSPDDVDSDREVDRLLGIFNINEEDEDLWLENS